MQHRISSVAILLVASVFVSAEAPRGAHAPTTTDPAGLVVHEWGTFTSVAADDGSPVEWVPQLGPQELPCFVERVNMNIKGWLPATVRMETPVLYFYSAEKRTVDVRVKFRRGAITEWYPRADVFPKEILPASLKLPGLEGTVTWNGVEVLPRADETYPVGDKSNHYYAARRTDASPVEVGNQREKFLFYRGVGNFTVPVSARLSADGHVTAASSSGRPLGDVMLFENQGGTIKFRAVQSKEPSATLTLPSSAAGIDAVRKSLVATLVQRGLFAKEAAAMVETWRDSWFEEGQRLFYIVDRRDVDDILPLDVTPAPTAVARVFVGRIELITPSVIAEVRSALEAGDKAAVRRYGRFLRPILQRISQTVPATGAASWQRQQQFAFTAVSPSLGACQ